MGKRESLRGIHAFGSVEDFLLPGKDDRQVEKMSQHGGNGDAADFDGENLGHLNTFKAFLEVLC